MLDKIKDRLKEETNKRLRDTLDKPVHTLVTEPEDAFESFKHEERRQENTTPEGIYLGDGIYVK